MRTRRYTVLSAAREVGFWLLAALVMLPIYFLVSTSLKPTEEATRAPFALPEAPSFDNYSSAWNDAGAAGATFATAMVNSVLVTVITVVLLIALGAPAAYALARRTSRLGTALFGLFMAGIMLPAQLGFIPLFVFFANAGLNGTRFGLVLVYVGTLLPLSIFLYTGFFRRLAPDYEEAAYVDGASTPQVFVQVVLPLMRPITATVALLTGLLVWNDFFTPLVFVGGSANITLPVAVHSFVGQFGTQWNVVFAAIVIALLPVMVVYLFSQRYLIRGFASGVRG